MARYRVVMLEVWEQGYEVDADSAEEAREEVRNGGGDIVDGDFDYSRTLPSDGWTVERLDEGEGDDEIEIEDEDEDDYDNEEDE